MAARKKPQVPSFSLVILLPNGKRLKAGEACSYAEALALYILAGAEARPGSPPQTKQLIAARNRFIAATQKYIDERTQEDGFQVTDRAAKPRQRKGS